MDCVVRGISMGDNRHKFYVSNDIYKNQELSKLHIEFLRKFKLKYGNRPYRNNRWR